MCICFHKKKNTVIELKLALLWCHYSISHRVYIYSTFQPIIRLTRRRHLHDMCALTMEFPARFRFCFICLLLKRLCHSLNWPLVRQSYPSDMESKTLIYRYFTPSTLISLKCVCCLYMHICWIYIYLYMVCWWTDECAFDYNDVSSLFNIVTHLFANYY